jgi:hypothetical protein
MLSAKGNPTMAHLTLIFAALRRELKGGIYGADGHLCIAIVDLLLKLVTCHRTLQSQL